MTNPTHHTSTEAGGPAMPDQGKFHYYDQPPIFTVNLRVSGTASLTIAAETREEAKAKAREIIERDDFEADLEDCDDVDISYISEHPTRMYLITRPESQYDWNVQAPAGRFAEGTRSARPRSWGWRPGPPPAHWS